MDPNDDAMHTSRRQFLRTGIAATGALSLGLPAVAVPARHPLRILILGGTGLTGPHLVAHALERGHSVTTFTRGRTTPRTHRDVFDRVEQLIGDRGGDLSALEGRKWDVVIDNSGMRVEWTRASAELLRDATDLYLYTSSTGVYYPYLGSDITEDTKVLLEEPAESNIEYQYGVMKARSEQEALKVFGPERTIVVRPTYMIGPGDASDRFVLWPERLWRGGEVIIPGRPDDPVQYIDPRDLVEFGVRLIEDRATGTYNVAGPSGHMGVREFAHGVRAAMSVDVEWVEIDDYEFLLEHNVPYVVPWIMPVANDYGSARVNLDRALAAGLRYRPLATTVMDFNRWWASDAVPSERRDRIRNDPEGLVQREAAIIQAWRERGQR